MTCYRCKQLFVRTLFGLACGCTVLTGHAEEPPHGKYNLPQTRIEVAAVSGTSTQANTASSYTTGGSTAPLFTYPIRSTEGSG